MKCVLLSAGNSTRLGGQTPKPLVPVCDVPPLHRNLKWLASHGVVDVFINLHYKKQVIRASVGNGAEFGVKITYSEERTLLGTAGAVKNICNNHLKGTTEDLLVVYGDNILSFDLDDMMSFHCGRSSELTIAMFDPFKHMNTGIYGGKICLDMFGFVNSFLEGGIYAETDKFFVNAGVYIVNPSIIKTIADPPKSTDWSKDVFQLPFLSLLGYVIREGYCLGIDTPLACKTANQILTRLENHEP